MSRPSWASRDTISKMCRFSAPPGYVRSKPPGKPKLGSLIPVIDAIPGGDDRFGRPGKGNDKGKVEGLVKNGRRRFLTPVPAAESLEALNAKWEANCLAELDRKVSGQSETIGVRLEADLAVFRPLPSGAFEACEKRTARVSSTALVRYRMSDYSVPTTYGFRDVVVKGFVDQVVIICDGQEIARYKRSHDRGAFVCDPLHRVSARCSCVDGSRVAREK
jgi:hypothetical protein